MRLETESANVACPYCGEAIELVVDLSQPDQEYVEDCFVCCRPIVVTLNLDSEGDIAVWVRSEDEA